MLLPVYTRAVIPMKWLKAWKAHVGYAAPGEDPDTVAKGGESPGQMYLDKLVKVWCACVCVCVCVCVLVQSCVRVYVCSCVVG